MDEGGCDDSGTDGVRSRPESQTDGNWNTGGNRMWKHASLAVCFGSFVLREINGFACFVLLLFSLFCLSSCIRCI